MGVRPLLQVNRELFENRKPVSIGIDPGWKNLGLAIVTESDLPWKVRVVGSMTLNPSKDDRIFVESLPVIINSLMEDTLRYDVDYLTIERYVPYNNVFSSETENITMLIGMIRSRFFHRNECNEEGITPTMVRAIDWKVFMAQTMTKNCKFDNPSSSLDKKYSIALAKFITNNEYVINTDHEADAICLAAIPFFKRQISRANSGNKIPIPAA